MRSQRNTRLSTPANSNRPPHYSNEYVEEEVPFIWRGTLEDALMQASQSSDDNQIFELKFSLFKATFATIINHLIINLFLYLLIQNQFQLEGSLWLDLVFYALTAIMMMYHVIWFFIISYKLNHSQFYLNRNYNEYSRPDAIFYGVSNPDLCSPPPEYTPILSSGGSQPPGYGSLCTGSSSGSGVNRNNIVS